jgi:hypothetical protein
VLNEEELDRMIKTCLFNKKQAVKKYLAKNKGLLELIKLDIELETLLKVRYGENKK